MKDEVRMDVLVQFGGFQEDFSMTIDADADLETFERQRDEQVAVLTEQFRALISDWSYVVRFLAST